MSAYSFAKGREVLPVLEVRRSIETDLLLAGKRHEPMIAIPSHFRITEVCDVAHEYGVAFVLGEGITAVGAIRDRLMLPDTLGLSEDSYDSVLSEAGGVVFVNDCRTGEDRSDRIRIKYNGVFLPSEEVGRSGMSPVHRSPGSTKGIVLVVEVPYAVRLVVEHTIRVIHPVRLRRVVIDRTERFVRRVRSRAMSAAHQEHGSRQQSKKKVFFHRMYFY